MKRMVFNEGQEGCAHVWNEEVRRWEELAAVAGDPEKQKKNTWQYIATVRVCQKCGREELCGGTILVPHGGDYDGGEYLLEPDGSRGMRIGD